MIIAVLTCLIRDYSFSDWQKFTDRFGDANLLQTWAYAEAKARTGPWRIERGTFEESGQIKGAFQALIRDLPVVGGGLVWINRGPLWRIKGEPEYPDNLMQMFGLLHSKYVGEQGMYMRIAPMVEITGTSDEGSDVNDLENNVLGPVTFRNYGFEDAGSLGWASAILDIEPPLDELRKNLKAKWRGHLNKGQRGNLDIVSGDGGDIMTEFLSGHERLLADGGFETSVTAEFLRAFQDALPEDGKMVALLARSGGQTVGSVLMAVHGNCAEYLAGNTSAEGRRLNAGQVLLWHAIEQMKERGFKKLDLSGMDKSLTPPGIYSFKEGVGGTPYRLVPEMEAGGSSLRGRLVRWRVNRARATV